MQSSLRRFSSIRLIVLVSTSFTFPAQPAEFCHTPGITILRKTNFTKVVAEDIETGGTLYNPYDNTRSTPEVIYDVSLPHIMLLTQR